MTSWVLVDRKTSIQLRMFPRTPCCFSLWNSNYGGTRLKALVKCRCMASIGCLAFSALARSTMVIMSSISHDLQFLKPC